MELNQEVDVHKSSVFGIS